MLRAVLLGLVLLTAPVATAMAAPVGETELIERYFSGLKEGNAQKALDALFSNTPAMKKNAAALDALVGATGTYLNYYGPVIDWRKVKEDAYAPGIKRQFWLLRAENGPLFLKFDMYEGPNGWAIQKVTLIEDFDAAYELAK